MPSGATEEGVAHVVAACAEGYSFPTNLDRDQPIGGLAPQTQAELVAQAVREGVDGRELRERLAAQAAGLPSESRTLTDRAERWRPWRSYAVQLLWASGDHAAARLPGAPPHATMTTTTTTETP